MTRWLQDGQLMPIIILTAAAFLLMTSMRRRKPTAQAPAPVVPTSRVRESDEAASGARRDIEELLVELQELSRRIGAEIDTRFAKLEAAMKDADRRIATLNRLSRGDSVSPSSVSTSSGNGIAAEPGRSAGDPDARHKIIYELADAGHQSVDIARELGRTPGEVELILNLRRQAQARVNK